MKRSGKVDSKSVEEARRSLPALAGSGKGLWGRSSPHVVARLRVTS